MTPLAARIAELVRQNGPISVADYMALCLSDPTDGYYMRREPFGREGDFITAPEVSQIFGELIGAWAIATWEAMEAPARFALAELGPGRGTLMKDMLRVARLRPAFLAAATIHLVETSPRLRAIQEETLAGTSVAWHDSIDRLPDIPTILIANEFFDALPIRQFVRTATGWAERVVGLDADGALAFGLRPLSIPTTSSSGWTGGSASTGIPPKRRAPANDPPVQPESDVSEGGIVELSPATTAIAGTIAARLAKNTGAALFIDYGYAGPAVGDTFQAIARHRYTSPLEAPGEGDITAHVDFTALADAARAAGAVPRPLVTQGAFLASLGLAARAGSLKRGKDAATIAAIDAATARLAGPEGMGNLFKVLAISSPGLVLPAFDDNSV